MDTVDVAVVGAGFGCLGAALSLAERGARVVRVHDVKETVLALKVWQAMQEQD